jgi:acyl dehydratase
MNLEVSTITFGLPGATITLRSQILNLKLLNESALYKRFTNYSCQCVNVRKEQRIVTVISSARQYRSLTKKSIGCNQLKLTDWLD